MITIKFRDFAAVKRVALNVNPLVVKKEKIANKINQLNKEYNDLCQRIEGHEMGIKALTGGYTSEDLLTRVMVETGELDDKGKPKKTPKWQLKKGVTYNEEKNVYEINFKEPLIDEVKDDEEIDNSEKVDEKEISLITGISYDAPDPSEFAHHDENGNEF